MHNRRSRPRAAVAAILLATLGIVGALAGDRPDDRKLQKDDLVALAKRIEGEVEELRGWKFKQPVKTDVRTEQQLRGFLLKTIEEDYGGGLLERKQAFLRMVGLIPPDSDVRRTIVDVLLNQVGGFYDPKTKTFYMMIREGIPYNEPIQRIMIAHELTHALDDQYIDLEPLLHPEDMSEDGTLAAGAVVEGSATVLMQRYMLKMLAEDADLSGMDEVMQAEMKRMEALQELPRYYMALVANYICGMSFMTRGDLTAMHDPQLGERMQKNVLAAAKDPPTSTEQVLHPRKYWDDALRDEPVLVEEQTVRRTLEQPGRHVVHADTVGELLCALLAIPLDEPLDIITLALPTAWTNDAAMGWGGDRFFLLAPARDPRAESKPKELRGLWVTAWDTRDDREEFIEDYEWQRKLPGRATARLGDRAALFFFGFSEAERERVLEQLRENPLKFTKGGKPWSPAAP